MGSQFGNYHLREGTLHCPRCDNKGTVKWEVSDTLHNDPGQMVHIQGPFYERISKRAPYPIELVCISCKTVQSGPTPGDVSHAA